jgi:CheY-like chemotaxis protein
MKRSIAVSLDAGGPESLVQRLFRGGRSRTRTNGRPTGGKHARVLLVDDDASHRLLCSLGLDMAGIEVVEAEDGKRGFERACSERPDLVVLDVDMPGVDGFELAEALARDRRTRKIPYVFLSGEAEAENEGRARALGALAYLTKPLEPTALASIVAGVLRLPKDQGALS